MKLKRTLILILFIISTKPFLSTFAEDYARWELPEGAKLRLGKGKIFESDRRPSFQFSPDSSEFIVFSSIGIWVYDSQTGEELRLIPRNMEANHDNNIVSPDLKLFASLTGKWNEPEINLWDFNSGKLQATLVGHKQDVTSMAFSPNGKILVSGDFDGVMQIWDISTGQHKRIQTPHNTVGKILFSPNGQTILSSRSGQFLLWDVDTGNLVSELKGTDGIRTINYSPNGQLLIGTNDWWIVLWDALTGKIKMTIKVPAQRWRTLLAITPDGKTLASVSVNKDKVQLWDLQTQKLNETLRGKPEHVKTVHVDEDEFFWQISSKRVYSMVFSPDGRTLALSTQNELQVWDTVTGNYKIKFRSKGTIYRLLFSPDGRTLAAIGNRWQDESGICLFTIDTIDVQKSGLRCFLTEHRPIVNSVTFSPDGQTLASGYRSENIRLWDVATGKLTMVFKGHRYPLWVQSVDFSPNGKTLASLSISIQSSASKAEILLWDVDTGKYQKTLKGHQKMIGNSISCHSSSIAFAPDGKTLVSGSLDGTVRLWNMSSIAADSSIDKMQKVFSDYRKGVLKGHTDQVRSVAINPAGNTIASASFDKNVRIWDMQAQELKNVFKRHNKEVNCVTFSADGRTVASADASGTIYLWDPITTDLKTVFVVDPNVNRSVMSLAFSPNGKTLASGGRDIHLWDIDKEQLMKVFKGHRGFVNSVKFSPHGRTLASGSSDGTVLIWDLE